VFAGVASLFTSLNTSLGNLTKEHDKQQAMNTENRSKLAAAMPDVDSGMSQFKDLFDKGICARLFFASFITLMICQELI